MTLQQALDQWLPGASARLDHAALGPSSHAIGRVDSVADGVAHISGLPDARLNELLRFDNGDSGFVQALEQDTLACVLLDDGARLSAGMSVRGSNEVLRVPVGPALLGRVLDPLGRPLDGLEPPVPVRHDPIERDAPPIIARAAVTQPIQTGILAIDALFALGRGQRELIIGDRGTGKSAIAIDTIINQRDSDVVCIYVAIGQKTSAVEQAIQAVRRYGNAGRTLFVVATAASMPGMQWIAPFAAMSMAEYFRDQGQHALIVIDDLSKHAATHRELALLTRQPPGREAYPGDVFYLHARLLERAAKLAPQAGGGSLTALPIAETDAGNLSAYIPTNLISITDGQIVLDSGLFHGGHLPAIDTGLSVSRVGGKTQAPLLRQVVETLRLDYAQFLELEMFTRFGAAAFDSQVQRKLARGQRTRAALAQGRYDGQSLAAQIALLLALQRGLLDPLPLAAVAQLRQRLPAWLEQDGAPLPQAARAGAAAPQLLDQLAAALGRLAGAS